MLLKMLELMIYRAQSFILPQLHVRCVKELFYGPIYQKFIMAVIFRDEDFYSKWNDSEDDNYGMELEREACLKLFKDYSDMDHNLY